MAILEIKKFNEPVLRRKCKEVRKVNKEIRELIVNIAKTMIKNRGAGLSAPQVGVSKRVIVVVTDLANERIFEMIDPKIIKKSKETEIREEGCLSYPGIFLKIKRAKEIEVEGLDIKGRKINLKAKNFLARVFQHEIDHLDGILFFNRLSFIQKIKFKLKYSKIHF